jgi:MinD-like ATPase involved in chromosome partitioning or flagellar assembly
METVTFYSYKGGVGRTTLLAQCARDLARRGARVIAVDFDLDAPGLHYRLRPERSEVTRGAVDLVDDYLTRGTLYASLDDATYLARTDTPLSSGWVRVLPAGAAPSSSYWDVLSRIDWRAFLYAPGAIGPTFLQDLLEQLRVQYDPHVVLIDSRTGITELSHAALSLLADRVVCVLVDNDENLDGARAVLHGVSARRMREEAVAVPLHVVVSRTDPTLPWSTREARIREALEATTESAVAAPLKIASVHELPHEPALARGDRLDLALHEAPWGGASALVREMSALAGLLLSEGARSRKRPEPHRWDATLHRGAVWSYGQFVMSFGDLEVTGLYRDGEWAYAVCPELATASEDTRVAAGEALGARATATAPIRLVASPPANATRCAEPDLTDLVELHDFPFTRRTLLTELDLRLPVDFPDFWGGGKAPQFQVTTARPLSDAERAHLEQVFSSFGFGQWLRLKTDVDESLRDTPPTFRGARGDGDIELIPARRLPRTFSANARSLLEADEALWMARRHDVHAGVVKVSGDLLPEAARVPRLRILVDATVFPHPGAADLLAWCDQIVIALPLADRADAQLAAMGLDTVSLVQLAREGRALVLLPQPLDRYAPPLVNELVEAAPDAMVLSRRLCAASIVALQRRLGPWIYPTFGVRHRHEFLRRLTSVSHAADSLRGGTDATSIFHALLPMVRDHWPRSEVLAHLYGANAMGFSGASTLIAETLRLQIPGDFTLESGSVARGIAWADAFGAAFAPVDPPAPGYSERRLCERALQILAVLAGLHTRSADLQPPFTVGPWTLRAPVTDASTADASRALYAMLAEVSEDAVPRGDTPPLWMLTRD